MPFPQQRGAAASAPAAPPAPAAPMIAPPAAPGVPAAPTAPPVAPPAPERQFYAHINGATVPKTESEARALPPTTMIIPADNQAAGWAAVSAVFPTAPAPAVPAAGGMGRSAFAPPARPTAAPAMGGAPRGMFAGVANADVIRQGSYLNPGDYVARVCSAEYKQGRQKNMIIIEVELLESTYDPSKPETHDSNRAGSRASIFINQNDSFASNMKEIMLAVSGFDPATGKPRDVNDTVTEAECDALISPDQPFTGAYVYLEARNKTTKNNTEFTRIQWWPMPMKADPANPANQIADFDRLFSQVR